MKYITISKIVIFVGLIITNMITYKSCNRYKDLSDQKSDDYNSLLVTMDSIKNLPPDTILSPPKIIKKDSLIYVDRHKPIPIDTKAYSDSIINDSIDARVYIKADNLHSIQWAYKPIYKYQEKIIRENVPYPVNIIKKIKEPQSGFYFNAGLAIGNKVGAKLGLQYLTKKQDSYTLGYMRYGNESIYSITYGIKLFK